MPTVAEAQAAVRRIPAWERGALAIRDGYMQIEARVARATQVVGEAAPPALLTLLNRQNLYVKQLTELRNELHRLGEQAIAEAEARGYRRGVGLADWGIVAIVIGLGFVVGATLAALYSVSQNADIARIEAQANATRLESATRVWEDQARQVAPGGQLPPLPQIPGQQRPQDGPGDQIAKGAGALALLAMVVGGLWFFGGSRRR